MSTTESPQNLAHNSAIVLTGPTRGLGLATVVHLARHPSVPRLLLLGRPGQSCRSGAIGWRLTRGADQLGAKRSGLDPTSW